MNIGIVGSEDRAVALGRMLASCGHDVTISDPGEHEAAERAAAQAGGTPETPYNQAMTREIIFFMTPRASMDAIITCMGGATTQAVIVDAMTGTVAGPPSVHNGAELLARKLDSHRVVRALIVLAQPGANIPICGDDETAKALVNEAFEACGCLTADRGPLANAGELEPPRGAVAA
jgi:predicted dinucleotide-binding enzyme